jgi:hypothetical protein
MSLITITFDETGIPFFEKLPAGAFASNFSTPPDGQPRNAISINARGLYTVRIVSPDGALADVTVTPPVKLLKFDPEQITLEVDAVRLPSVQSYGTAAFTVYGEPYALGFLVNPSSLLVPIAVSVAGEIGVDPEDLPIGISFDPQDHEFNVWTGGGYTFAFSLPSQNMVSIQAIQFNDPPGPITAEISADQLTAWVRNNYLKESQETIPVSFDLVLMTTNGSQGGPGTIIADPTIINNPINQGGSGGGDYVEERRSKPVTAGGVFAA